MELTGEIENKRRYGEIRKFLLYKEY